MYLGQFLLGMYRWPGGAPTSLSILWPIIESILVTFGQMRNFCEPNLVTFYLCMLLILNKENFSPYNTNILVSLLTVNMKNCLAPKIRKCATPLKTRPHNSQTSRENATQSSRTSPLTSYKEVPNRGKCISVGIVQYSTVLFGCKEMTWLKLNTAAGLSICRRTFGVG